MYTREKELIQKIVLGAYNKCVKNKLQTVDEKDNKNYNQDLVTNCDVACEKYIIERIKKYFPGDNIVSEETNAKNKIKSGRWWVIDPIDGTINFARGIEIYCIQVAFLVDGECQLAVIYCPTIKKILVADTEKFTINGKPFSIKKEKELKDCLVLMGDLSPKSKDIFKLQLHLVENLDKKCERVRLLGSAGYEFGLLACGKIDAFIISYKNNIWDKEPGMFVCKMAGCETYTTTYKDTNISFACVNKTLMDEIIKNIKNFQNKESKK